MKKEFAVLSRNTHAIKAGKIVPVPEEPFEVEVMARVRGYAMVRRKGCVPFVAEERLLFTAPEVASVAGR